MQQTNKYIKRLLFAGWFGIFLFIIAGIPDGSYQIFDVKVSILITNYLKSSPALSNFLYHFNSIDEVYINVPAILLLQLLLIKRLPLEKRKPAVISVLASIIWLELWILLVINTLLVDVFTMDVHIVPEVNSWISETNRIISSESSLISRHVFTMVFLSLYFADAGHSKFSKILVWACALTFAVPQLLNVNHWISDWLFSVWFTYSAFNLSRLIPIEKLIYKLASLFSKQK